MATAPVNIGLIGLGPFWDNHYRPALAKLNQRLKVVCVYDNVRNRAEQAARDTQSQVVGGITALTRRSDVHALFWLDAGWQGTAVTSVLIQSQKPILMGVKYELPLSALHAFHERAIAQGQIIVPVFPKRCTPASIRLQELLATQLGRPQHIEIKISPTSLTTVPFATSTDFGGAEPPAQDPQLEWTDWLQYLLRAAPKKVTAENDGQIRSFEFAAAIPASEAIAVESAIRTAKISLMPTPPVPNEPTCDEVRIQCENGTARLIGSSRIEWSIDNDSHADGLASERSETEVMLDLFCRRITGNLVPVPDLLDLIRAKEPQNLP